MFEEVDDALEFKLSKLMFAGPIEQLTLTENAQPALMAASVATLRVLEREAGIGVATHAALVMGHSLGEYSALAAAGSLPLGDTARLLRRRGLAMQRAVPPGEGAMAALLGVELDVAEAICTEARAKPADEEAGTEASVQVVEVANDNGGGQVVISGHREAVERAIEVAKGRGVKRAMLLPVSAPFHCSLMAPAAREMEGGAGRRLARRPHGAADQQRHRRQGHRPRGDPRAAGAPGDRRGAVAGICHGRRRDRRRPLRRARRRPRVGGPREADRARRGGGLRGHAGRDRGAGPAVLTVAGVPQHERSGRMGMFSLEGRVALVTGASGGIGGAIAQALHAAGATVALSGTRVEALEDAAARLGGRTGVHAADLSDPAAPAALVRAVEERHGPLDILVNNAGLTRDGLAMRMRDEDWQRVLEVDLSAPFRLCRAALPGMVRRRHGRIVNIASVVGVTGNAGQANYAAAKAGLIGLTKSLAREIASRGITVNAVAPGFVETAMTEKLTEAQRTAAAAQIPIGRLGTSADIAAGVLYLASDEAAWVTGTTLHINGGMAMP